VSLPKGQVMVQCDKIYGRPRGSNPGPALHKLHAIPLYHWLFLNCNVVCIYLKFHVLVVGG